MNQPAPQSRNNPKKALDPALVTLARETIRRARNKLEGRLTLRKVKGHSGDHWNEVADALAGVGRTLATDHQPCTAALADRVRRALDGLGSPQRVTTHCHGFAWQHPAP